MENLPFHIKATEKSYEEAVISVKEAAKDYGFNTVAEHTMHQTFKKNDLEWDKKYCIISICNPQKAHKALSLDLRLGCFMPKNIIVFQDDSMKTNIMLLKQEPATMDNYFPYKKVGDLSASVTQTLINIINNSI